MCMSDGGSDKSEPDTATRARIERQQQEALLGRQFTDADYDLVEVKDADRVTGEKYEKGVKGWTYRKQLKVPVLEQIKTASLNIPHPVTSGF